MCLAHVFLKSYASRLNSASRLRPYAGANHPARHVNRYFPQLLRRGFVNIDNRNQIRRKTFPIGFSFYIDFYFILIIVSFMAFVDFQFASHRNVFDFITVIFGWPLLLDFCVEHTPDKCNLFIFVMCCWL